MDNKHTIIVTFNSDCYCFPDAQAARLNNNVGNHPVAKTCFAFCLQCSISCPHSALSTNVNVLRDQLKNVVIFIL